MVYKMVGLNLGAEPPPGKEALLSVDADLPKSSKQNSSPWKITLLFPKNLGLRKLLTSQYFSSICLGVRESRHLLMPELKKIVAQTIKNI